ncbi:hypothetical protein TKK_0003252 [Trichogramma kaykai]
MASPLFNGDSKTLIRNKENSATAAKVQKVGALIKFWSEKNKKNFIKKEIELINHNNFKDVDEVELSQIVDKYSASPPPEISPIEENDVNSEIERADAFPTLSQILDIDSASPPPEVSSLDENDVQSEIQSTEPPPKKNEKITVTCKKTS